MGSFGPTTINIPALLNVTNPGFSGPSFSQSQNLGPDSHLLPTQRGRSALSSLRSAAITFSGRRSAAIRAAAPYRSPAACSSNCRSARRGWRRRFLLRAAEQQRRRSAYRPSSRRAVTNLGLFFYTDIYFLSGLTLTP